MKQTCKSCALFQESPMGKDFCALTRLPVKREDFCSKHRMEIDICDNCHNPTLNAIIEIDGEIIHTYCPNCYSMEAK